MRLKVGMHTTRVRPACTMYAGSSDVARALSAADFSRWLAQSPSKRSQLTPISMTSIPCT